MLRHFEYDDAAALQKLSYNDMPLKEIQSMICDWRKCEYKGKYFEMLAVIHNGGIVGEASLFEISDTVISIGIRVFPAYQRQGFGKKAVDTALEIAKNKGYKIVSQQVRSDNAPSIALHQSLGFETDGREYINQKGNKVIIFLKALY